VESVRSAVDSKRMEFAFNFSSLSMSDLDVAAVSFFMTDWKMATDFSDGILPLGKWQIGMYSKAFGGILINEVYNNRGTTDWIEFYNTGTLPITLTGWVIYDGTMVIYVFGAITINPGGLFVVTGLSLSKNGDLRLANAGGTLIDSVSARENGNPKSYARVGAPPYSTWKDLMPPSPGAVNPGQVPIPEFSDILIPLIGMIGMFAFMRTRRRKVKDG
jgi:hypothetical protein